MHFDYAKSLIQNENSAPMLFDVRHLVLAAPCTLQKDCLIRVPNRLLLSTALLGYYWITQTTIRYHNVVVRAQTKLAEEGELGLIPEAPAREIRVCTCAGWAMN